MQTNMGVSKKALQCWPMNYGSTGKNHASPGGRINTGDAIKLLIVIIAVFELFAACTPKVKDYIPGTYTTGWSTEFTDAKDTMIIEPPPEGGSIVYQITRNISMIYLGKPKYDTVKWTGTFNADNKTIIVNQTGVILSFDPVHHLMRIGSAAYKKL